MQNKTTDAHYFEMEDQNGKVLRCRYTITKLESLLRNVSIIFGGSLIWV